jgi:hypothetical protein
MSRPPAATELILPIFLEKKSPGREIGLGRIGCSIFCLVLHRRSTLSLSCVPGASSQNAEYVYFFPMQEKYAANRKYFRGRAAVGRRSRLGDYDLDGRKRAARATEFHCWTRGK